MASSTRTSAGASGSAGLCVRARPFSSDSSFARVSARDQPLDGVHLGVPGGEAGPRRVSSLPLRVLERWSTRMRLSQP